MDLDMFTQVAEVTRCLYLSSAAAVQGDKIRQLRVTQVINLTVEIPNLTLPGLDSLQIQIEDSRNANLGVYFDKCADKIDQVDRQGGRTLVHCVAGISRSTSICLAYLMKYRRMPLDQAFRHIKRVRRIINPNISFWRQLIDYERRIFGRTTVKIVQSNIGPVPDLYITEIKPPEMWTPRRPSYGNIHSGVTTAGSGLSGSLDRTGRMSGTHSYDRAQRGASVSHSYDRNKRGESLSHSYDRSQRGESVSHSYDRSKRGESLSHSYDRGQRGESVSRMPAGEMSSYSKPRSHSLSTNRLPRTTDPSLGITTHNYSLPVRSTDYNRSYIYRKYHTGI